jgi:hypothetical protein
MRVLRREFYEFGDGDILRIVPIGDVHLGAAGCDEELLAATVAEIAANPDCRWIGMGDYCDFINKSDKRFDPLTLAPWVGMRELADLPKAQVRRFLQFIHPIASQCLGLVNGNHEFMIQSRYERDIYSEIVAGVKNLSLFEADYPLALGYGGWLQLAFYNSDNKKGGSSVMRVSLHHGFVDGRLEGGKALNMQRWLWQNDCDLALMGHSHNTLVTLQDAISLDKSGHIQYKTKKGAFCGTFLGAPVQDGDPYYERGGYYHAPVGTIRVKLKPGAKRQPERVSITV